MRLKTENIEETTCLVAGHHFYQRGDELIDEAADRIKPGNTVRVDFDSPEYFRLIIRHPEAVPAFRAARRVKMVLDNKIYDVIA